MTGEICAPSLMINLGRVPAGDISGSKAFNLLLSTVTLHGPPHPGVAEEETPPSPVPGPLMGEGAGPGQR